MFNSINTSGKGTISYSEFITAGMEQSFLLSTQNLTMAFQILAVQSEDSDEQYIPRQTLHDAFYQAEEDGEHDSGCDWDNDIWNDIVGAIKDKERIDKDEFFKIMKDAVENEARRSLGSL